MKDDVGELLVKGRTNRRKQPETRSVSDEAVGMGGHASEWVLCYDPRYPNRGYWYPRNTDLPE
jgi:hypothetical protein